MAAPKHAQTHWLSSASARPTPNSWLRVTRTQRNSQAKAKIPESRQGRGSPAPSQKRVQEEGPGCEPQSGSQLLVAASRVHHMLLFSSLSPEAARQQVPLAAFSAVYTLTRLRRLVPPPQQPGSQESRPGGQGTRMTGTPPPHQPGLSWAHHRACQEKIKGYLLSTSGQQRAAPSLSSPFSTGPGAHSLICETATKYLPTTKY